MRFPRKLVEFTRQQTWSFAKAMPVWPHEYIVRQRVDLRLFEQLASRIRAHGYEGRFYSKVITYYEEDGLLYWTMGAPLENTAVINRCRKEDSYESRLRAGTLP